MAYRTSLPLHPTEDGKPKKIGGKQGPRAGERDKGGRERRIVRKGPIDALPKHKSKSVTVKDKSGNTKSTKLKMVSPRGTNKMKMKYNKDGTQKSYKHVTKEKGSKRKVYKETSTKVKRK